MVFHGFGLVSMVFQGGFIVFSWFLVGFHGFSRWFHGFCLVSMIFKVVSWFFMVFGWFPWFLKVSRWIFIVINGPRLVKSELSASETLRTPKRYSLHLYLGPTIPLGLAGRRPAFA